MFAKRVISPLLCALLISQTLAARQTRARAADDLGAGGAESAREAKALALLDGVIEDARALRLPEDRVFVQTTAAGLLWEHDEDRARHVYAEALSGLLELAQVRDENGGRGEGVVCLCAEMREKLVDEVAQRDAALAREFLEGTRGLVRPEDEAQLQLKLAARTTASDPRQALRVARASLSKGVSAELTGLLSGLRQSDAEAAASLARELLEKLRTEDLANNFEAATVAFELLHMSAAPPAGVPLLNSEGVSELSSLIASAALRPAGGNEELLLTLPTVMPEIEKYAPSLAPRLRRRIAQANRTFDKERDDGDAQAAGQDEAGVVAGLRPRTRAERAVGMIKRAAEHERSGERREALELLGEARGLLEAPARDSGELGSQLLLAQGYVVLDPQVSLEILGRLIEQLNTLADAAVAVDGFLTEERLSREGELLLQPLSESFGGMLDDEGAGLCSLARVEFDQTVAIVDRLQRPEARILARLFVARAVLSPPRQPHRQTARARVPARGHYPG
ncbi:MAG TPA: hypothetical protein VE713_02285 [Pyrinomonadaceae bacterium]|nr:hypothetical protein [Pyrinomonadaceae bacterium]